MPLAINFFFFLKFKREEGITESGFGDLQIFNDEIDFLDRIEVK